MAIENVLSKMRFVSFFLCRRVCLFVFFVAIAFLLHGCGGGNSKSSTNNGGGTGAALTEQTRTAALDAVAAAYDTLPQTSATDDASALLAFIHTRPEFSASGIARDNSVWARFTDNRPLVITLNDFPLKDSKAAALAASRAVSVHRSDSGSPTELPGSNKFYLVNTREENDPAVTSTFDQLENNFLPPNSYQPIVIDGTIEHLKVIDNAGVLYNIGHAGLGYKGTPRDDPGTPEYVFGTLTRRTPGSDTTYNAELTSGEVGYLLEPTLLDRVTSAPLSRYKLASGYFITDAFVRKYWTFAANSIFVSDNCDGGTTEAQPFMQACFDKGLSVYLGWDNAVANSNANESALFLFDRLLGNNDLSAARQPEHPQQRPFDYFSVLDQMATLPRYQAGSVPGLTLTSSFSIDSVGYGFLRGGKAFLKDFRNQADNQGNGGILSPTISQASFNERTAEVALYGIFGTDPGSDSHSVLVGGVDMTAQTTWTPVKLTIKNLPVTGAGSSGDIQVNVRGHLSNQVQLTEWRGTFTVTQQRNGDELKTAIYNAHFRGILNFLRLSIGKTPVPPPPDGKVGITAASDSTCIISASGEDRLPTVVESITLAGDPNVPVAPGEPQNPNRYASLGFTLDESVSPPKFNIGAVVAVGGDGTGLLTTTNDLTTGNTHSFVYDYSIFAGGEHTGDYTGHLDDNYNIAAGSFDSQTSAFHTDLKIVWGDIAAIHPPKTADTSVSRSQR